MGLYEPLSYTLSAPIHCSSRSQTKSWHDAPGQILLLCKCVWTRPWDCQNKMNRGCTGVSGMCLSMCAHCRCSPPDFSTALKWVWRAVPCCTITQATLHPTETRGLGCTQTWSSPQVKLSLSSACLWGVGSIATTHTTPLSPMLPPFSERCYPKSRNFRTHIWISEHWADSVPRDLHYQAQCSHPHFRLWDWGVKTPSNQAP